MIMGTNNILQKNKKRLHTLTEEDALLSLALPSCFCPPGWIFGSRQKVNQSIIPLAGPRCCCEKRWHLSRPDDICKFICLPLCEAASPVSKAVKGLVSLVRTTPQSLLSPPLLREECSSAGVLPGTWWQTEPRDVIDRIDNRHLAWTAMKLSVVHCETSHIYVWRSYSQGFTMNTCGQLCLSSSTLWLTEASVMSRVNVWL